MADRDLKLSLVITADGKVAVREVGHLAGELEKAGVKGEQAGEKIRSTFRDQPLPLLDRLIERSNAARAGFERLQNVASLALEGVREKLVRIAALGTAETVAQIRGVQFQADFADVRKTVEGTEQDFRRLRAEIIRLGDSIGAPIPDLTRIAATAGQLGLPLQDIGRFTELAAKGAVAFGVSAEEMAGFLGDLKNQFGLTLEQLGFFTDQINHVADRSKVTERELLNLINRVGGATRNFGLLRSESVALGAAILSLGKNPELAATGINLLLNRLLSAKTQSAEFQAGLKALGFDLNTLGAQIDAGPNEVLKEFLARIEELNPQGRATILSALIGEAGESKEVIGDLILSLKEYTRLLGVANEQGIAGSVDRTFAERERTVKAAIQRLSNSLNTLAVTAAELFLPTLELVVGGLQNLAVWFRRINEEFPNLTGFVRVTAVIGTLVTIIGFFGTRFGQLVGIVLAGSAAIANPLAALAVTLVAFASRFGGIIAGARALGVLLLRLVGGPIGLLVSAIVFAIVKINQFAASTIELAGAQVKGSQIIQAAWQTIKQVIVGTIRDALIALGNMVGISAKDWDTFKSQAKQAWADLKKSIRNFLGEWQIDWKRTINFLIAEFLAVPKFIGAALGYLVDTFGNRMDALVGLAKAAGRDIQNALSFQFSAENLSSALANAAGDEVQAYNNFLASLKDIGADFDRDFVGELTGKFLANLKGTQAPQPDDPRPEKQDRSGKSINLPETGGKGRRSGRDSAADDARQIADAELSVEIEKIAKLEAIANAHFERERAQAEAAKAEKVRDAKGDEQLVLAAEKDLSRQLEEIERSRVESQRSFAEEKLNLQIAAKKAEVDALLALGAKADTGELAKLQAEVEQLVLQLETVGETAALAVEKLTSEEQRAVAERAEEQRQALQDVIDKYDELGAAQRDFAAQAALIADSNLPLQRKLALLDEIGKKYKELAADFDEDGKRQQQIADNVARNIQSSFADFLFNPWEKGIKGMALSFAETMRKILAQALAADILSAVGLGGKDNKGGNLAALGNGIAGLFGFGGKDKQTPGENELGQLIAIESQKTAAVAAGEAERGAIKAQGAAVEEQSLLQRLFAFLFGETTKTGAVAAGQTAQTGAVVVGEATRGTVEKAGALVSIALTVKKSLKKIAAFAAEAAAGAYAAMADIPYVGPVIGAIAAGLTFAAVLAFGALTGGAFFAEGGRAKDVRKGGRMSGPGTSTSDSIPVQLSTGPANVSDGEGIIKSDSLAKLDQKYGAGFFDALNRSGEIPPEVAYQLSPAATQTYRFNLGGRSGETPSLASSRKQNNPSPAAAMRPEVKITNITTLDRRSILDIVASTDADELIFNALGRNPSKLQRLATAKR